MAGAASVFGVPFNPEPGPQTGLLLMWGNDPLYYMGGDVKESIRSAILAAAKLVVIDPKRIDAAKRADLWISPRPQSDGALALGIIKVMIEEKLYDADFVAKWTVGFEELEKEIKTFSFEDVEKATWVPKAKMEKAARLLAENKPLCYLPGNALERGINAFQTIRAVNIIQALVGDLNVPGGNVLGKPAPFVRMGTFFLLKGSPRKLERGLCNPFRVGMQSAYVPTQALVRAILDEKPYPIKAAMCILSDPLVSYPDSVATYQAFMKLDFFVVSELFPTPTTAVADIILPAAWQAEHDVVGYWPGWFGEIRAYPKIVDPPGEARPDPEWINELAKRVGLRQYFWENWQDCLDEVLKPSGLTYEQLKVVRCLKTKCDYQKPEEGIFPTPSGKVEIYNKGLEKIGYSPLPRFNELSQFRYEASEEYPLLMFNGKEAAYMLTGYKHVKYARALRPNPTVDLNPETAKKLGLKEGEWVCIENERGRVKQILRLDPDLHPGLVYASWGWWFPEEPEDLFQFRKSNINVLTDSKEPYNRETGSVELGGIPCRVYKA